MSRVISAYGAFPPLYVTALSAVLTTQLQPIKAKIIQPDRDLLSHSILLHAQYQLIHRYLVDVPRDSVNIGYTVFFTTFTGVKVQSVVH